MSKGTRPGLLELALALLPLAGILLVGLLLATATAQPSSPVAGVAPPGHWRELSPETVLTRIGFGSCLVQTRPQPIWDGVMATRPQLFIMMGDNVYGDVSGPQMTELIDAYLQQGRHPDFARARRVLPFLATWDDHDYGANDLGADFPHAKAARALFDEFWGVKGERARRPGVYDSAIYGPPGRRVQIILLDTRSFRSPLGRKAPDAPGPGKWRPDPDPSKTMLGAEQWAWLERELGRPAEIRLLVSSVQVLAEGHDFERWGNLPRERERLLGLIASTGAKGVILLSGDRHFGALYQLGDGQPYLIHEATSSSLNRPLPPHLSMETGGPGRLHEPVRPENFGLLEIDWEGRRLDLSLRGIDGRFIIGAMAIPFRQLGLE